MYNIKPKHTQYINILIYFMKSQQIIYQVDAFTTNAI